MDRLEEESNDRYLLLGHYPKKLENIYSQRYIHPNVLYSIIHSGQDTETTPKCPSVEDWIKRMWHIHAMGYYLAMRKDEILPSATTWIDLEDVMLSEISRSEKVKNHMTLLIWDIKTKLIDTDRQQNGGYQREGGGGSRGVRGPNLW